MTRYRVEFRDGTRIEIEAGSQDQARERALRQRVQDSYYMGDRPPKYFPIKSAKRATNYGSNK